MPPNVDVNMMVYDCVDTVGVAIESVLAQTWPAVTLTLLDNGSTDGTLRVLEDYAARHPHVRVKRNRCNAGAIANIQRAFWLGDADFVMPKTSDDLIAPDYIERLMGVLLEHPDCVMCHAAGLVFSGSHHVEYCYPVEHLLDATGPDAVGRTRHVMHRYTSAPGFWGVYRRDAVDQLSANIPLSPLKSLVNTDGAMLAHVLAHTQSSALRLLGTPSPGHGRRAQQAAFALSRVGSRRGPGFE